MLIKSEKNPNRPITREDGIPTLYSLILSLILLPASVNGQQQQPPPSQDLYPYARFSSSMAIIIAVLVTALFFMGFFSIYIRRCSDSSATGGSIRATLSLRSRHAAAARGLDASVIETFPTLAYSEVKHLKIGKGALECAVCLNEFEDDETLRLLPKCDHVFHPECIDLWLASHVTCPVCRADLVPKPGESTNPSEQQQLSDSDEHQSPISAETITSSDGEIHVRINPDDDQVVVDCNNNNMQEPPRTGVMKRIGSLRSNRPPRSGSVRAKLVGFGNKFTRSHSTGHSLVQLGETYDRFTLRLPAEVRKEVIKKALLNPTGSCCAAGLTAEPSGRKGYRTGEGSNRGKSYRRLGSLETVAKSERWAFSRMPSFLTRALSIKSPRMVAEGDASTSTKTGGGSVKIDEASLVANDSAKVPVNTKKKSQF